MKIPKHQKCISRRKQKENLLNNTQTQNKHLYFSYYLYSNKATKIQKLLREDADIFPVFFP